MGLTEKKLIVRASFGSPKEIVVEFLIDSGAVYSLVPGEQLAELDIEPYKEMDFFWRTEPK